VIGIIRPCHQFSGMFVLSQQQLADVSSQAAAEAIHESYTLVRLSSVKEGETLKETDDTIGSIPYVVNITSLNDGSWRMLVLKAYLPFLRSKLGYDPAEPTKDDVNYFRLDTARNVCLKWCAERAKERMGESWLIAKIFYTYLLEVRIRGVQKRLGVLEGFNIII